MRVVKIYFAIKFSLFFIVKLPGALCIMDVMSMLPIIDNPEFVQLAETAISQYVKEVHELTYVEHGTDNLVALVNKEYVFRFPRNNQSAVRIAYETAVLQIIKGKINVTRIPEAIEVHTLPLYIVSGYIHGDHLSGKEMQALPESEQALIGQTLAQFIHQLNQAISGLQVRRLREESMVNRLDEPWEQYFERIFVRGPIPNDKLVPVVQEQYALWKDLTAHEQNTYAIHDDLHPGNLLFENGTLTGIVDFGDVNTGSIESELRWTYLMGDTIVHAAIDHYKALTGVEIDYHRVRIWAVMHQLAYFTTRLARQETETYLFKRAQECLRAWIPNFPL
jgi:aminoglycoside 2''-phosphotransferase